MTEDEKLDQEIAHVFSLIQEQESRLTTYRPELWEKMRERLRKCGIKV